MSVPWHSADTNPNPTEGCVCYTANNPDQPKNGGWLNPAREFRDLGHASPHVFICRGCPNLPKDLFDADEPEVVDSTAVEVAENQPELPVAPKRKAARATD